jgi:hypothetical protein
VQPTRRQVLLGGLVLTAACTTERSPRPSAPSRDELLRAEAVQREQALVTAYADALGERPELTSLLAPLLGDHSAHLAALGGTVATASPLPSSSSPPAPPRSRAVVLRSLAAQERAAAAAHAAAAELAEADVPCSRRLAPLLASLAASEASHLVVL